MSSYRADKAPSYDHTLLSSVPDPTRAEKQEGYRVDLLDESRDRRDHTPPNGAPSDSHGPTTTGNIPGAAGYAGKEGSANNYEPVVKKVPWYRTRWGIGVIALVILVIIGGIVGGVVAGTHHTSNNRSIASSPSGQGQEKGSSAAPSISGSQTSQTQQSGVSSSSSLATTAQQQQQQQGPGALSTPLPSAPPSSAPPSSGSLALASTR